MISDIPPWLNINIWQWSVHRAEQGIAWTEKMDYQVRRYMLGEVVVQTAALCAGATQKQLEARAEILMIAAVDATARAR